MEQRKTQRLLRLILGILLSALWIATGAAFVFGAVGIYRSGAAPYTPESIAQGFGRIAPLAFSTLGVTAVCGVLSLFFPRGERAHGRHLPSLLRRQRRRTGKREETEVRRRRLLAIPFLAVILASLISGYWGWNLSGGYYLHMTLFLALAVLYPSMELNLWIFIFPLRLKARWLAWAYAVLIGIDLLRSALSLNLAGVLLPVVSMLNFLVFFWEEMMDFLGFHTGRMRHQTSRQTIQFKSAVRDQKKKEAQRGYRHKCTVCGRTDVTNPELEFRYCSRCSGYHCYCSEHISNHTHIE
jgi:hypothetical protein